MIGTVYKIEVDKDNIYIGSTTQRLCNRQGLHNFHYRDNTKINKLYEECRKHNITKIICILLEEREIENELEIRQLEQEYIDKLEPSLNSWSAYTSEEYKKKKNKEKLKEYYQDNKDKLIEKQKEYNKNNKEKIKEKNKKYYENNKNKMIMYVKEYRNNNTYKVQEKRKEYYDNNRDKLLEKVNCDICNKFVSRVSLLRHQRSKKCLSHKTI